MKSAVLMLSIIAVFLSMPSIAQEQFATKNEAQAMVVKAVAAVKANRAKTLEGITAKDPKYINRDLYVTVYDMAGNVLAHGANNKMVGNNLLDMKDVDGKEFVKERLEWANTKGKFWQEYKFTDPVTKKVLPKEMYCEKADDMVVCAGVYKR